MKFLYIALGSFLIWNQPAAAEDSSDFGLDDETVIIEEEIPVDSARDFQNSDKTEFEIEEFFEEAKDTSADSELSTFENTDNMPEELIPNNISGSDTIQNEVITDDNAAGDAPQEEPLIDSSDDNLSLSERKPAEAETAATETNQITEEESLEPESEISEKPVEISAEEKPQEAEKETEDIASKEDEDNKTKEEYEEEISFYIKNMNLSVEQLDMAKYISNDSRLKIEQLLKSIYLLRSQARELEAKSLNDFEAILTEEQREQFHKLRDLQEKAREKFEVLHVQLDEESEDAVSDAISEGTENAEENKENE